MSASDRIPLRNRDLVLRLFSSPPLLASTMGHFGVVGRTPEGYLALMFPRDSTEASRFRPSEDVYPYTLSPPSVQGASISYDLIENRRGGHRYRLELTPSGRYVVIMVKFVKSSGLIKSPHVEPEHLLEHIKSSLGELEKGETQGEEEPLPDFVSLEEVRTDVNGLISKIRELTSGKVTGALKFRSQEGEGRIVLRSGEVKFAEFRRGENAIAGSDVFASIIYLKGEVEIEVAQVDYDRVLDWVQERVERGKRSVKGR